MNLSFDNLRSLLRKPAADPAVLKSIQTNVAGIKRSAHVGYFDMKDAGISAMFKEAQWIVPSSDITDATALHVEGFHFHREGHEGHSQYTGQLPGNIEFSDSENDVLSKLGRPVASGGGGFSKTLRKPI